MNIWVSKHIDVAKHKDIIIDTLIALKAELGEKLNERAIWVSDLWKDSISGSCFEPKNHVIYVTGGVSCRFPSVVCQAYIDLAACVRPDGEKYLCAYIDELRPEENVRNIFCIKCIEPNTRNVELYGDLFVSKGYVACVDGSVCYRFYVDIENRTISIPYNPI